MDVITHNSSEVVGQWPHSMASRRVAPLLELLRVLLKASVRVVNYLLGGDGQPLGTIFYFWMLRKIKIKKKKGFFFFFLNDFKS